MVEALVFGAVASSGLLLGALVGTLWAPPQRVLAFLLAFASGALIAALAYELFGRAEDTGGLLVSALALLAGAAVFVGVASLLDRLARGKEATGFALVAAVTLDGIPENLALGLTVAGGAGSFVLLVAIFASNFPEALSGTVDIGAEGGHRLRAVAIWLAAALLLAASVVAGRFLFAGAGDSTIAILLAFAGGAVLASLADTIMPEAYAEGGPLVAFGTVAGFLLSYALSGQ